MAEELDPDDLVGAAEVQAILKLSHPSSVTTSWEYGYDWFNRLTSVTKNSTQVESYTYDESDNRKTMTRPLVSELWEYSYDLADQLESITVTVGAGSPVLVESFTSLQMKTAMSSRATRVAW